MNMCLDEGMLQAYMDGELAPAQMETCAAHLATCATCAELAHEAEHEYALCASAFASVLSIPAPTARLRVRLEDAIAGLQAPQRRIVASPISRLRARVAALTASFTIKPRYVGAFASFLVAVALTITLTLLRPKQQPATEIAQSGHEKAPTVTPAISSSATQNEKEVEANSTGAVVASSGGLPAKTFQVTKFRPKISVERGGEARRVEEVRPVMPPSAPLLPDEKKYMTTIATLDAAIKAQGQTALPPSLRTEYERNLAVVDQAIIATRVAARRNPQDTDAKEFLRAAYQNKVDLLTTVADQTQFIAARD